MKFKSSLSLFWAIGLFGMSTLVGCSMVESQEISNNGAAQTRSTPVVVRILNLDLIPFAQPTETDTLAVFTPTAVPLLQSTETPMITSPSTASDAPTSTPSCINRAEFVKHLTVSDNTAMEAGQFFSKIWQIKNTGTCQWTTGYSLRFFSGDQMNAPAQIELPQLVNPGETLDLRVILVAPTGIYSSAGNWVLSDPFGNLFGFGENGDEPISVVIQIKPTPKPTPG